MFTYYHNLPSNCPPSTATSQTTTLYRLVLKEDIAGSFLNYSEEYPNNPVYKKNCGAMGLSFWNDNTCEKAKELEKKDNMKGKVWAKIHIDETIGPIIVNENGHVNLWLYKGFDPLKLKIEFDI